MKRYQLTHAEIEQRRQAGRVDHGRRFTLAKVAESKRCRIAKVGGYMRWYGMSAEDRKAEMARVRAGVKEQ